ncbi:SMI1/KNR4 family protein [Bacillus halotolerans]|uniref:SMI1/KNR4 family protein n=1 Tax=Bacillus halotolerans TaxID=260554 RepID=UPI00404B9E52
MVEWDFGEHPVGNEEIIEVENMLQVKFPKDYLDYVKIYSGATPLLKLLILKIGKELHSNTYIASIKKEVIYSKRF